MPIKNSLTIVVLLLWMLGCATQHDQKITRICDASGCADRSTDSSSIELASTLSAEESTRMAALEKTADKDPTAAYDLSLRYFRGDGVRQDSYRSLKWMRDAGERGNLNAQIALGRLYLIGMGEMGADPAEAEKWLSITASRGDQEAVTLLEEVQVLRQSKQEQYLWRQRWQPLFYNRWHADYRYYWRWNSGVWVVW